MSMRAAQIIVDAIIGDIKDRRDWKTMWDTTDEDIREEIRTRWIEIVERSILKVMSWQKG